MALAAKALPPDPDPRDQRVFFYGVSWEDYQRLVEMRGEDPGPRMTYLDGTLEIMTNSAPHETLKKRFARLVEAWSEEMGVDLDGVGSWTLRNELAKRGLEPDECYFVGPFDPSANAPHIAIEVIWTSGGLNKLAVYAGLGVREVWFWEKGYVSFHALRNERYEEIPRSKLLPQLDSHLIERPMNAETTQTQAVRDLRATLRARNKD